MGVFDTFSKRKKREESPSGLSFKYDDLPSSFRIQVYHILNATLGPWYSRNPFFGHTDYSHSAPYWDSIHKTLIKEFGVHRLSDRGDNTKEDCLYYLQSGPTERVLDLVELSFKACKDAHVKLPPFYMQEAGISQTSVDAIDELNKRFLEHSLGYQFVDGQIVRMDSKHLHEEVVKKAFQLISQNEFLGANEEFHKAHEYYKKGDTKAAITEAQKAVESVLKTTCGLKNWPVPAPETMSALVDTIFRNGLVPKELQSLFTALSATLKSGSVVVRNKKSAHGQGAQKIEVPLWLASYVLNLSASTICFVVEAYSASK